MLKVTESSLGFCRIDQYQRSLVAVNSERFRGRGVFLNKTRFPLRFHFAAASGGHCASLQASSCTKRQRKKKKKNAKTVSVVCFLCALFPFPHHLHDCQHSAWQCQLAVYRLTVD